MKDNEDRVRKRGYLVFFAAIGALCVWGAAAGVNELLVRWEIATTNIMAGWPGVITLLSMFAGLLALEVFLVRLPFDSS